MPPQSSSNNPELGLEDISAPSGVPEAPDPETAEEERALARDEAEYRRMHRRLDIQDRIQNMNARRRYAMGTFIMVCVWLLCVFVVTILQGLGAFGEPFYFHRGFPIRFRLDSTVMTALIATTTANIIGLLVIVMKYLFPTQDPSKP